MQCLVSGHVIFTYYKCSAHGCVDRDVASCVRGPEFDFRCRHRFSLHTGGDRGHCLSLEWSNFDN